MEWRLCLCQRCRGLKKSREKRGGGEGDAPLLLFSRLEVRLCGSDRDSSGELAVGGCKGCLEPFSLSDGGTEHGEAVVYHPVVLCNANERRKTNTSLHFILDQTHRLV